jgi:hypothetical protein
MALRARHGDMQSDQREAAQVVIKCHIGTPTFRLMALLAIRTQLACVHILCAMALVTRRAQFLFANDRRMTGMAVDLDVLACQHKFGIAIVIEFVRLPSARIVALAAFVA